MDFFWGGVFVFIFKLPWHLLLSEALPSVALQLESRLVSQDDILKLLLLVYALYTPCNSLLLVGISNCLTIPHRRKCPAKFIGYPSNGSSPILHILRAKSLVEDVLQRRSSQLIILSHRIINAPVVRFWYFFGGPLHGQSRTVPVAHHLVMVFWTE